MKLQFKEVKYLKYFRMCFFSYLDATKSKSLDFVCPSMSFKLKSERRFQLTFNACRLIKGKSLRLHFDAFWGFFILQLLI